MSRISVPTRAEGLEPRLRCWVDEGLITTEQAERIRLVEHTNGLSRTEAVPPRTPQRTSVVVEALGYLGGVIILVAAVLVLVQFWKDIPTGIRLAIVGAAALGLLGGGLAVPRSLGPVGMRLRSVLLLLAVAATAAFLGLLGGDTLDWQAEESALLAAAGAAVVAGGMWWRLKLVPQQIGLLTPLMVTAAVATSQLGGPAELPGLGAWGVAAVWTLLAGGGLIQPRRAGVLMGAAGVIFAAMLTFPADAGLGLGLATVATVVLVGVLVRDLVLVTLGAIGAVQVLPVTVMEWFPGRFAAPAVLLAVGGLLVAAAVFVARRRGRRGMQEKHRWSSNLLPARWAIGLAGLVALAVVVTLLAIVATA